MSLFFMVFSFHLPNFGKNHLVSGKNWSVFGKNRLKLTTPVFRKTDQLIGQTDRFIGETGYISVSRFSLFLHRLRCVSVKFF
jgi:hypothetical protein